MYEYTYLPDLPQKNDFNGLSSFFEGDAPLDYLAARERQLIEEFGSNWAKIKPRMSMAEHAVESRRVRWACISAESQREKKTDSGISYICKVYDNLTTIRPRYERDTGIKPPDNTGNHIFKFSERSRKRLMNRARRLNKSELELPFFVTLTYHKNYTDCERAKQHLNTFFERWRKREPRFEYFWKMEPQKRGAVHFHIAMFLPDRLQRLLMYRHFNHLRGNKNFTVSRLDAIRLQIQNDWAEVTAEVDGYPVPFTRFKYMRNNRRNPESSIKKESYFVKGSRRNVYTRLSDPRVEYKMEPDIEHRLYGTNVRRVDNWKMFLGYIYKYMQKEVREHPFGLPKLKGRILSDPGKFERPPAAWMAPDIDIIQKRTGRFWGFSYGLDFAALTVGIVDHEELENVNDYANALNTFAFASLTEHLIENSKRKKKELADRPKALEKALRKYRAIYESQKKRFLAQRDKIKAGYGLQFEINNKLALDCERYLRSKSVNEFFNFP